MPSGDTIARELFLLERDFQINYTNSCVNIHSSVFALNSLCTCCPWIPKKGRCQLPFLKRQRLKKMKLFSAVMWLFTGRARKRSRNWSLVGAELSQLHSWAMTSVLWGQWTFLTRICFPNQQCSLLFLKDLRPWSCGYSHVLSTQIAWESAYTFGI